MKDTTSVESAAFGRSIEQPNSGHRQSKLDHLPVRLLRSSDVQSRTGLSRATISRLEQRGEFPKRIKISANIVARLEEDIEGWVRSRLGAERM